MALFKKIPLAFYILICYTCLSGCLAFERILNTDNSYYFFNIVNSKYFWFAENRMGVAFSQIPLLLSVHLGLPLSTLIYVYSLTFPIEYFSVAFICYYYLNVKEAALTLALALITGVAYSFFHPVTETYHALMFVVLVYAILVSDRFKHKPVFYYTLLLGVSFLCIVSHPIAVFILGFVALFALISKQITTTPFLSLLVVCGLSLVLRLVLVDPSSYDVKQYDNLFNAFSTINHWSDAYPLVFITSRSDNTYLSSLMFIAALIFIAVYTKKTFILLCSLGCALGLAALGTLTFLNGDADMMMEKTFLPSIFMLLLPFCYLMEFDTYFPKTSLHIIVILMALIGFKQIIKASQIATERLHVLSAISSKTSYPKLVAQIDDFGEPSLYFNHWNTPVDSYIITKCKTKKAFSLFLTNDKYTFQFDSTDTQLFLGPPWAPFWNKKMINQTYFELPPVGYHVYQNIGK